MAGRASRARYSAPRSGPVGIDTVPSLLICWVAFIWKNDTAPHINTFELGQYGRSRARRGFSERERIEPGARKPHVPSRRFGLRIDGGREEQSAQDGRCRTGSLSALAFSRKAGRPRFQKSDKPSELLLGLDRGGTASALKRLKSC
jgi:hypothetical protein